MKIDKIHKELLKNLDEKWSESTKEHFIKKSKQFKNEYDKAIKKLKISILGMLIVITLLNAIMIWITKIVVSIRVLIVFSELYLFFLTCDDYYSGLKKILINDIYKLKKECIEMEEENQERMKFVMGAMDFFRLL